MTAEDIDRVADTIADGWNFSDLISREVDDAIRAEFDNVGSYCDDITSESELSDYADTLKSLGPRAGISTTALDHALGRIEERIAELGEHSYRSSEPRGLPKAAPAPEAFDDAALLSLFDGLRRPLD